MPENKNFKDNIAGRIVWFIRPSDIKHIIWEDAKYPCDETVNFEPDGDGRSKYIWAYRKRDNRFMRVGKIIKNYMVMPMIFGLTQFLTMLTAFYGILNDNCSTICIYCLYGILLLVLLHYLLYMVDFRKVTYV